MTLEDFADELDAELADVREVEPRLRPFNRLALGVRIRINETRLVYVKTGFNSIARWDSTLWDAEWTGQQVFSFAYLNETEGQDAEALKVEVEVVDPPASVLKPGLKWARARARIREMGRPHRCSPSELDLPKRIQRKRVKGWRKPAGAVSVTRPGKWGNPYTPIRGAFSLAWCIEAYERHVLRSVAEGTLDLGELRGKDLMCWCKPGAPCHADILLRLANEPPTEVARPAPP